MEKDFSAGPVIGDFTFSMLTESEKKMPFYLIGAGINYHQDLDPHSRPDGYPHYQWIQVKEGSGTFHIDGTEHKIGRNQGILIFPHIAHEYRAQTSPWIVNWFTFNGEGLKEYLMQLNIERTGVYSVADTGLFPGIIKRALKLLRSANPFQVIDGSLLVNEFLVSFVKHAHPGYTDTAYKLYSRLNPVLHYIDDHFSESLSIEDMAEIIGVTPQYLCQLFKKIINQRPIEYLNNVRINKSKDLLIKFPKMKVDEISKKSGYDSSSYFCSIFKRNEGMSPGRFRELHLHHGML